MPRTSSGHAKAYASDPGPACSDTVRTADLPALHTDVESCSNGAAGPAALLYKHTGMLDAGSSRGLPSGLTGMALLPGYMSGPPGGSDGSAVPAKSPAQSELRARSHELAHDAVEGESGFGSGDETGVPSPWQGHSPVHGAGHMPPVQVFSALGLPSLRLARPPSTPVGSASSGDTASMAMPVPVATPYAVPPGHVVRYNLGSIGKALKATMPAEFCAALEQVPAVAASLAFGDSEPTAMPAVVPRTLHSLTQARGTGGWWAGQHVPPHEYAQLMYMHHLASLSGVRDSPAASQARQLLCELRTKFPTLPAQMQALPEHALQAAHLYLAGHDVQVPLWREYCHWLNTSAVPATHMRSAEALPVTQYYVMNQAMVGTLCMDANMMTSALQRGEYPQLAHPKYAARRLEAWLDAIAHRLPYFQSEARMLRYSEHTDAATGELTYSCREVMCVEHVFLEFSSTGYLRSSSMYLTDIVTGADSLELADLCSLTPMLSFFLRAIAERDAHAGFRNMLLTARTNNLPLACLRVNTGGMMNAAFVSVFSVAALHGSSRLQQLPNQVPVRLVRAAERVLAGMMPAQQADVRAQCLEALPLYITTAQQCKSVFSSLNIGGELLEQKRKLRLQGRRMLVG